MAACSVGMRNYFDNLQCCQPFKKEQLQGRDSYTGLDKTRDPKRTNNLATLKQV